MGHSVSAAQRILTQMIGTAPANRRELRAWVRVMLGMRLPERAVCAHHVSPLAYLEQSFFEDSSGAGDAVVWACRGGGKTMMGAVATLLDLLFKPGIQVRILGGSFEQSEKMYDYLRALVQRHFLRSLAEPPTQRRLVLRNGSRVEVLAQSDTSVRGQRVQKLRCDEVELFDPAVWQAAQLTTRSVGLTVNGKPIRGTVEAFSTMHVPGGLMQRLLAEAKTSAARQIFSWCLWDVLEKCPQERVCDSCPLFPECRGRAKTPAGGGGFLKIDDAIAMKSRVSGAVWRHEMLCEPPRFEDAVFSGFARETHVRPYISERNERVICGVDFGFRHAFVCLWMAIREEGGRRAVWVIEELVTREKTLARNAELMRERPWPVETVFCDNAGGQMNGQTGTTDERVLKDAGFRVRKRFMQIEEGLAEILELLTPAHGPPRLFIDPRCERLIAAMQSYRRARDGSAIKDGTHDHLIDALRYALCGRESSGKVEVVHY